MRRNFYNCGLFHYPGTCLAQPLLSIILTLFLVIITFSVFIGLFVGHNRVHQRNVFRFGVLPVRIHYSLHAALCVSHVGISILWVVSATSSAPLPDVVREITNILFILVADFNSLQPACVGLDNWSLIYGTNMGGMRKLDPFL